MRLTELRMLKKLSQKELGELFNVSQHTISRWENGEREPDFATLCKLADFFDVTIDYLIRHTNTLILERQPAISAEDLETLGKIKSLPEEGRRIVDSVINAYKSRDDAATIEM